MLESSCNITAFSEWSSSQLEDDDLPLTLHRFRRDLLQVDRSQKETWRIMEFDDKHEEFVDLYGGRRPKRLNITHFQAMEVSSNWCKDEIQSMKGTNSGDHGPPPEFLSDDYHGDFLLTVHDAMCSEYCILSDQLRSEAIAVSGCNCLELSTKEGDISFTKAGDFCLKNSGRILCEEIDLDVCDKCELEDFTCPRREYDQIEAPLKGYGDQCNIGQMSLSSSLFLLLGIEFLGFSLRHVTGL